MPPTGGCSPCPAGHGLHVHAENILTEVLDADGNPCPPGQTGGRDGHVVAFDDTVQFSVRKAGSWKSTILGAEGLVTDFTGPGRVWMQTRSSGDLMTWIQSKLPPSRK